MAQELVVNVWCDVCMAEGQREPGESVTVSLDGRAARELDLCERDRKAYVAPLAELLENLGRRVETKPKRTRAAAAVVPSGAPLEHLEGEGPRCPICDLELPVGKTSVRDHLVRNHDTNTQALFGNVCPVCGGAVGYMGQHVHRAHHELGLRNGADAFEWARVNGDPFGAYAERIAPLRAAR